MKRIYFHLSSVLILLLLWAGLINLALDRGLIPVGTSASISNSVAWYNDRGQKIGVTEGNLSSLPITLENSPKLSVRNQVRLIKPVNRPRSMLETLMAPSS